MPDDSPATDGAKATTGLASYALVIGIDAYGGGIATLQSAVRDATAIGALLANDHQYHVTCLVDEAATRRAILQFLDALPATLTADSAFLLYYAGHGVAHGDGTAGPQGYLLPHDASKTDEASWLSMVDVVAALERLPCRHLLVVLDCCFAGAFRWASSREVEVVDRPLYSSQYARYLAGDAWQALTSASADERAADLLPGRENLRDSADVGGHSPFAAALIRGLSGDADSARAGYEPDGVITAIELYQYVFERLTPRDAAPSQTPGIWPLKPINKGEFIFLNPRRALNTRPDPPLDEANNPWLGLESYSEHHADLFCGRRRVVDALVQRVVASATPSLLAVVGASGTGKSSVVKAGLLPLMTGGDGHLREGSGQWTVVSCARLTATPEAQIEESVRALDAAPSDARRLLFIDQFEELYTQCTDPDRRRTVLERLRTLIDGPSGTTVVLTLRSDYEPRPASEGALSGARWEAARFVVPAFTSEELREVIEVPARMKAVFFEPATLVGMVLDDVASMPGALPLLSFALAELYRQAQRRRQASGTADRALLAADYREIGGVAGAVQQRATALSNAADSAHQASIRRVFLRMVTQEGARVTRRRVHGSELVYPDAAENVRVDEVIAQYVQARLLVKDGPFIEPAHDSLVVGWQSLQDWLTASGSQELIRSIWREATDWQANGYAAGFLWDRDPRLPLLASPTIELNKLERQFADTSIRRKARQKRLLLGTVAAVIAALAFAAGYAGLKAREATRQSEVATANSLDANARRLLFASRGQLGVDNDLALLLAVEGASVRPLPDFTGLLRAGLSTRGQTIRTLEHDCDHATQNCVNGRVNDAAWDPSGQRIVSTSYDDNTIRVWDAHSGATLMKCLSGMSTAAWSPDGTHVAAGGLWGNDTGIWTLGRPCDEARMLPIGNVVHAAWRPGGAQLVTVTRLGDIEVWSAAGDLIWERSGDGLENDQGVQINDVEWNADGSRFVTASNDGTARVWDWSGKAGTQRAVAAELKRGGPEVRSVAWNPAPNDARIVTALADNTARVWDGNTGRELARLKGHSLPLNGAVWNPTGTRIVTTSDDATAWVWDAQGVQQSVLVGHTGQVLSAAWDPSGAYIVTGSEDGTARIWTAATGKQRAVLAGHKGPVIAASFAPHAESDLGAHVLTASSDGSVRVWDPDLQGPATFALEADEFAAEGKASWSRDGARIATAGTKDGRVGVWNADTGQRLLELSVKGRVAHVGGASIARWSPDDQRLLTAGVDDGATRVWAALTGRLLLDLPHPKGRVNDAAWSPDGRRIMTAVGNDAFVWDATDPTKRPKRLEHGGAVLRGMWNPSSTWLVTTNTGLGGYPWAHLWNPDTDQRIDLMGHSDFAWYGEWSPDGTRVVTAGNDAVAIIWDAEGHEVGRLEADKSQATYLAWNSSGTRIASVHEDKRTRIWNPTRSKPLLVLDELGESPKYVAWSRDDRFIVTANKDSKVRVWDASSGALMQVLSGHAGPARYAAWNKTGTRIMTTGIDGTVRMHALDLADLLDAACRRVTRNMTAGEWTDYMGQLPLRKTCVNLP